MTTLLRIDMPACDYDSALRLQAEYVANVQADPTRAYLILTEHDPAVITIGRRGQRCDVLATPDQLTQRGVEVRDCSRGGQVALHGPGQLVAYPIVRLGGRRRSVHGHVRQLQQAVIETLGHFSIAADNCDDRVGVWAGSAKIASVGVAVEKWVSYHGLALNVCNDLSLFDLIVPCGAPGERMTSMAERLGETPRVADVADALAESFARLADLTITETLARGADLA